MNVIVQAGLAARTLRGSSRRFVRRVGTQAYPPRSDLPTLWQSLGAVGLATLTGLAGYSYANAASQPAPESTFVRNVNKAEQNARFVSTYGTAEDFEKAILDLQQHLPNSGETVSTDEGVLESHGRAYLDFILFIYQVLNSIVGFPRLLHE